MSMYKHSDLNLIKKYLKRNIYLFALLLCLCGVLDGLAFSLIMALMLNLSGGNELESDLIQKLDINVMSVGPLIYVLLIMVFISVKSSILYWTYKAIGDSKADILKSLKDRILGCYLNMRHDQNEGLDRGGLLNLIGEQCLRSVNAVTYYLQFCMSLVLGTVYILVASFIDYKMTLMLMIIGSACLYPYRLLHRRVIESADKIITTNQAVNSQFSNLITNILYIDITKSHKTYTDSFKKVTDLLKNENYAISRLSAISNTIKEPISLLIVTICTLISLLLFNTEIAELIVSVLLIYRAANAMMSCMANLQAAKEFIPSLKFVDSYLREGVDTENKRIKLSNGKKIYEFEYLEIKDVSVQRGGEEVLRNISHLVRKNTVTGITGPSGSGKSTLLAVLGGIIPLTQGVVEINGISLHKIDLNSWGSLIGFVPQHPSILAGTLYYNLTLADSYDKRDYEKLLGILKDLKLRSLIPRLHEELNDNSMKFSGGQLQRMNLAREIFRGRKIIVMDEPTSGLDEENVDNFKKIVSRMKSYSTIIIVSHEEKLRELYTSEIKLG